MAWRVRLIEANRLVLVLLAITAAAVAMLIAVADPTLHWEVALVIAASAVGWRGGAAIWLGWAVPFVLLRPQPLEAVLEATLVAGAAGATCWVVSRSPRPMTRLRQAWLVLGGFLVVSIALVAASNALLGGEAGPGETPREIVGALAMVSLGAAASWWQQHGRIRAALCLPIAIVAVTCLTVVAAAEVLRYRDVQSLQSDADRIAAALAAENDATMAVTGAQAVPVDGVALGPDNFATRMAAMMAGHQSITSAALVHIDTDGSSKVVATFDNVGGARAEVLSGWIRLEHDNTEAEDHHSEPGLADYVATVELPDPTEGRPATPHLVHAATLGVDSDGATTVLYSALSVDSLLRTTVRPTLVGSGGALVVLRVVQDDELVEIGRVKAVDDNGVEVDVPTEDPELVGITTFDLHDSTFQVIVRPSVGYGISHSNLRLILMALGSVGLGLFVTLAQRHINVAAADEARQRRQALLDAALAGSRGWAAVVDADDTVRIANEDPLGTTEGHDIGDVAVCAGDPVAIDRVRRLLAQARLNGSATATHVHEGEQGRTRIVEVVANVLPATGEERLCFVQLIDVTEDRERSMRMAQADRMEAIGSLAGGVAHDFNNLLFITLGYLQLMEQHAARKDDAQLASYVAPAIDAVRRGADVTKALLTVSGHHPLNERAFDLSEFVEELAPLVSQAVGKGVTVHYSMEPHAYTRVDSGRLSAGLLNLCANSRHALAGRVDPQVHISVTRRAAEHGDVLLLSVRDNGVGMSEDVIGRAFEPFFTTKGRGKGTGLGLAAVFSFAQQSGGTAYIESAEGIGTTVTIELKAAPQFDTGVGGQDSPTPMDRVLVVDDEKDIADLVASWLQDLGADVRIATTPGAALDIAERFEPQVLVCDAHLESDIDGLEVARRVLDRLPGTMVVFMTGFADRVRELEATGAVTLAKPFTHADFVEALRPDGGSIVKSGHAQVGS